MSLRDVAIWSRLRPVLRNRKPPPFTFLALDSPVMSRICCWLTPPILRMSFIRFPVNFGDVIGFAATDMPTLGFLIPSLGTLTEDSLVVAGVLESAYIPSAVGCGTT